MNKYDPITIDGRSGHIVAVYPDGYGIDFPDAEDIEFYSTDEITGPQSGNGIPDTDSGLGIGGINNDQSAPFVPSIRAIERMQRLHDTDTICRRCGASKNFGGAMFSTIGGMNICDDCA